MKTVSAWTHANHKSHIQTIGLDLLRPTLSAPITYFRTNSSSSKRPFRTNSSNADKTFNEHTKGKTFHEKHIKPFRTNTVLKAIHKHTQVRPFGTNLVAYVRPFMTNTVMPLHCTPLTLD